MRKRIARRIALVAASVTTAAFVAAAPALAAYPARHNPGETTCFRFFNPDGSTHFPGQMWTTYSIYALDLFPMADGEMQSVAVSTVAQRWSGASWLNVAVQDPWVGRAYDFHQPIYWYDRYGNRVTGESGGYQVFNIYQPGIYRIAVSFSWAANSTGSPAGSDYVTNLQTCTY
jgi:hypothetical protein